MATIGSEGDVTTRIGSTYDDKGTDAAVKGTADAVKKMNQKWELLEQAQKKLGITTQREKMEMVQAYKTLKSSGVASTEELRQAQLRLDQTLGKTPPLLERIKKSWVAIAATLFAMKKAWDFAASAAKFDQQEQAFTNLAASHGANARKIIDDLKRMSGQTVSTAGLMQSAGTAMLLGIPAHNLSRLMEIARASARVMGTDVQTAFNDIAKGVGRQSPLILDNLGIIVKLEKAYTDYAKEMNTTVAAMTDAEKKQAFLNAVMIAGGEIVQRVGVQSMTAAEGMAMFTAKMENARIFVGKLLISITSFLSSIATGFSTVFAGTLSLIATMLSKLIGLGSKLPFVGDMFKSAASAVNEFAEFQKEAAIQAANMSKKSTEVALAVWEEKKAVGALTDAQIKQRDAAAEATAQKKAAEEASKEFQKVNKGLITDINNMNDAYSKAILTDRQYILMKAEEMTADGKSTALIKQWTAAKLEALELKEREALIKEQEKEVAEAVDTSTQEFEQLQLQMEQQLLTEEQFEHLRFDRQMEQMEQRMLLIAEEGLLTAELEEEFRFAKENAAFLHTQKLIEIDEELTKKSLVNTKKRQWLAQSEAKVKGAANRAMENQMLRLIETGKFSVGEFAKVVAQTVKMELVGLAARSAVWAIFMTAMGFAHLAMFNPAAAAVAFQSAGTFALMAGASLAAAAGVQAVVGGGAERPEAGEPGGEPIFTQPGAGETSNVFNPAQTQQQPQIINNTTVTVEGNIVDQAAFARDLQPFLGEAEEDRVRAA